MVETTWHGGDELWGLRDATASFAALAVTHPSEWLSAARWFVRSFPDGMRAAEWGEEDVDRVVDLDPQPTLARLT